MSHILYALIIVGEVTLLIATGALTGNRSQELYLVAQAAGLSRPTPLYLVCFPISVGLKIITAPSIPIAAFLLLGPKQRVNRLISIAFRIVGPTGGRRGFRLFQSWLNVVQIPPPALGI